jgi:hypothetical protein
LGFASFSSFVCTFSSCFRRLQLSRPRKENLVPSILLDRLSFPFPSHPRVSCAARFRFIAFAAFTAFFLQVSRLGRNLVSVCASILRHVEYIPIGRWYFVPFPFPSFPFSCFLSSFFLLRCFRSYCVRLVPYRKSLVRGILFQE